MCTSVLPEKEKGSMNLVIANIKQTFQIHQASSETYLHLK